MDTLTICLEGMTEKAWQLNELVGSLFMKKSGAISISSAIAMKRHQTNGRIPHILDSDLGENFPDIAFCNCVVELRTFDIPWVQQLASETHG